MGVKHSHPIALDEKNTINKVPYRNIIYIADWLKTNCLKS